ncbi:MAG: DUF433 domain-containing protein [Cyanobacteria bacterium P01_G01_bin.54]
MSDRPLLKRITTNPAIMVGKPVIKGTRLTVEFILNLLTHGSTPTEILEEYEGLTTEDLQACRPFAAPSLSSTTLMSLAVVLALVRMIGNKRASIATRWINLESMLYNTLCVKRCDSVKPL